MKLSLYTLTSDLHSGLTKSAAQEPFIKDIEAALGCGFDCRNGDFSTFGMQDRDDFIYVRTGGTEGIFKSIFCASGKPEIPGGRPVRLLTSGQSNSLAASMEILSYLKMNGVPGEILHGSADEIAARIKAGFDNADVQCNEVYELAPDPALLEGTRLGVVGRPSDWLISSDVDYALAKERIGVEIIDISMDELKEEIAKGGWTLPFDINELNEPKYGIKMDAEDFEGALKVYGALRRLVDKYSLSGLTIRCFDLLTSVHNTGCLALAILNSEGIIGTCEGDVPAMMSMAIANKLCGTPGFQVNLSRIGERGSMLFAHCTVPFNIVDSYCYDTHFESGIGVAVHGVFKEGPMTIFKISPDCSRIIAKDVELTGNSYGNNLCRTQVLIKGNGLDNYLLHSPIGNHHILIPGHFTEVLKAGKK